MSGLAGVYDLRDEGQAREYLDKLGTEYRFQCYHEKLPDGCHRLADFLEAFKKDLPKARKVYQTNCDESKHAFSCFKYANYLMLGKAGEKNIEESFKYYNIGCDGGHTPSCYNVGLLYQDKSRKDKMDFLKAKEYFQKSCDLDDRQGCYMVGAYYLQGREGIPKNLQKAFDYMSKGCEMNHIYSCINLGMMYKRGDGVERNLELSQKYRDRAKKLHKEASDPEMKLTMGQSQ